jgi:hypothetical protein
MLRFIRITLLLGLLGLAGLLLYGRSRSHPEDMPWTALDLARPIGAFTGRKLAALSGDGAQCRALLGRAGVRYTALPDRSDGAQCGYRDAVRFRPGGALEAGFAPADLGTSCPVAAALALWEWHVVQPAAIRHFGTKVDRIEHFGSYSCRRMYGRGEGAWSEHSGANAVDIAGFRLRTGGGSACSATGRMATRKPSSSAKSATARAGCSPPCSRRLQCRAPRSLPFRPGGPGRMGLAGVPVMAECRTGAARPERSRGRT